MTAYAHPHPWHGRAWRRTVTGDAPENFDGPAMHEPDDDMPRRGGRGHRSGRGPGGPGPFGPGGFGPFGPRGFGPGPFGPRGFGPGPMGPGGFGPWGRRGARARRGDVRAAVLALLAEQPMHGYQIIGELAERSGGAWRPSPGSVYPVLQLLADEGLVRSEESDGRKVFHLTDAGRAQAGAAAGPKPWESRGEDLDEGLAELVQLVGQLTTAAWQVAEAGDPTQVDAAARELDRTRRSLYRILAADGSGSTESGTGDSSASGQH